MSNLPRVQIIGNYLSVLNDLLYKKNIKVENIISNCNPLAMVGCTDPQNTGFESKVTSPAALMMLRKNLKRNLAHDKNEFQQNIIIQNMGEEVRYANRSEWLILSNNLMGYGIYKKEEYIYSDTWQDKEFVSYLKDPNSGYKKMKIPYPGSFNWKYYYDMFIDAVLSEYPAERIILIKTSASQWYSDNDSGNIYEFDEKSIQYRRFIEEVDEYFIEKTNCRCINTMYSFISPTAAPCAFIYSQRAKLCYEIISEEIAGIIMQESDEKRCRYFNPCLKVMKKHLKDSIFRKCTRIFDEAEYKWSRIDSIVSRIAEENDTDFTLLINFISEKYMGLSDYISQNSEELDFKVINVYCRYIRTDINDICALYGLYKKQKYAAEVREALKILAETGSLRNLAEGQKLYYSNIGYLSDYPYIDQDMLTSETDNVVLVLSDSFGLGISVDSENPFRIVRLDKDNVDAEKIFNDGMICTINQAFDLCSNWKFYIMRTKKGMKNVPVSIVFNSKEEFIDSLYFINYTELLSNERFVIRLEDAPEKAYDDYKSIVDLDFLFLKKVAIFNVRQGLADQLCYYAMAEYMRERTGAEIFLDDVYCNRARVFNGLELPKVLAKDISDRLISTYVSDALSQSMGKQMADVLYDNGIDDMVAVVPYEGTNNSFIKNCPKLLIKDLNFAPIINANFRIMYSCLYVKPETYFKDFYKYIEFPVHSDPVNIEIEKQMKSSDAIVVHVRRGDYVSWGWDTDMDFYKESLEKLNNINDYPNKKYFVFSDDIPWCKNNLDAIGLNTVGKSEIIFVDNNKGEESFRDMQLMANAKVMIASNSGFVRMAALISRTCEVFMCYNLGVTKLFQQNVRRNKYEIGSYKKRYSTDYKNRAPKNNKLPTQE